MSDPPDKERVSQSQDDRQSEPTQLVEGPSEPAPDHHRGSHGSWPDYSNTQSGQASHPSYGYDSAQHGSQPRYDSAQSGSQPRYDRARHGSQPDYSASSQRVSQSAPTQAIASPSQSQVIFQKFQQPSGQQPSVSSDAVPPSSPSSVYQRPAAPPSGPQPPARSSRHSGVASFRFAQPGEDPVVQGRAPSGQQPSFPSLQTGTESGPAPAPPPRFPSPAGPVTPGGGRSSELSRPAATRSRDVYQTGDVAAGYSARQGAMRVNLPEPGEVLDDRYEIVKEIGAGGFGAVYKAHQRGLNKEVALKVLLPQVASIEDASARFRREAMLAKELRHPNTISVFDYGQTSDGLTYIAMELLEGHTLEEELVDHGAMSIERVRRIAGQVLKSLAEAHARGIVHRDLKPSNVMLVDVFGEKDFVKVLDFGIARAFEEHAESFKTQTGTVIGTPQYMAPEQLRGSDVGPEADLYAMGLIIAEMVTSNPVFNEENTNLVIVAQLSGEHVPIAEKVLNGPLGDAVYRATDKEPRLRFGSALKMLEQLEQDRPAPGRKERARRATSSGPVLHSVITKPRPAVKPPGARNKLRLVIALLVLAVATVSIVAYLVVERLSGNQSPVDGSAEGSVAVVSPPEAVPDPAADEARVQADRHGAIVANTVWRTASLVTLPTGGPEERATSRVRLVVLSEPMGADVYRGETRIGETPFNAEIDAGGDAEELTLQRRGYLDQTVVVDLTRDAVPATIVLERERTSRPDREDREDRSEASESEGSDSEPDGTEPESTTPVIPVLDIPVVRDPEPEPEEPEETEPTRPVIPTL